MIGNNELHINQATMIEAMQAYLDAQMVASPKVVSVEKASNSGYANDHTFVVKTTDREVVAP